MENLIIPKTFEEAWNKLYDYLVEKVKLGIIVLQSDAEALSVEQISARVHHNFGRQVRNYWGLWTENDLTKDFNSKGIFHADDMSGLIIDTALKKYFGEVIDFNEMAKVYWNHWINVCPGDFNNPKDISYKTKKFLEDNKITLK